MKNQKRFRCAVYTRKSHEEGLDQDFNSLDAQSEACRAYIASQAGLGWSLRDMVYQDGGVSGGHLKRDGLQTLLADVNAGLVDVIVVYKVDRLTRSLTDFSKLVDIFDKHDVSFVSVTQAFNTTTSMGRLTLNVLLSFAQFEREVTAERIRDKIAASKAKGMWMGGTVPLGYRNEDRTLLIREDEAVTIRTIFDLYLRHQNVRLVQEALNQRELKTRSGKSFSRGHIYRLLNNTIYIGQIQHKDTIYNGLHDPIISKITWDAVQVTLRENRSKRTTSSNSRSPTLLAGLVFDEQGQPLVPHHASKAGKRYEYYVNQRLKTGDQDTGWRVPAKVLERIVRDSLRSVFCSDGEMLRLLPLEEQPANETQDIIQRAKALGRDIDNRDRMSLKPLLCKIIRDIRLHPEKLTIRFNAFELGKRLNVALQGNSTIELSKPMKIKRRGQELKLIIGGIERSNREPDEALLKLVARAYALREGLETGRFGSILEFADAMGIDHADAKRMLPIGYLCPSVIQAILTGNQPDELTALGLKNGYALPNIWAEQCTKLGFQRN